MSTYLWQKYRTSTFEEKAEIISAAFDLAVKDADSEPTNTGKKPNAQVRWHRINYAIQKRIEEQIKSRYPDLYTAQYRRLWTALILDAFSLNLSGLSRHN